MSPNNFSTSCSSREDVGSSRISTLQSISTARAIATICWIAIEQLESCCVAFAGISSDFRILSASAFIFFQFCPIPFPRPMYMFSATERFGQSVISWYTVLIPRFCASCGERIATAPSCSFRKISPPSFS